MPARLPAASQRILRTSAATLSTTVLDADGEPDDDVTGVHVTLRASDGSAILTDQAATDAGASKPGVWTIALTRAQTAQLDTLTATWTSGSDTLDESVHEVVGGYIVGISEALAIDNSIAGNHTHDDLVTVRRAVEDEFERICGVAFVPRFERAVVNGSGHPWLLLPWPKPIRLRSVSQRRGSTDVAYTSPELAQLGLSDSGMIISAGRYFDYGLDDVTVAFEHGHTTTPAEVKRAFVTRFRERLNWHASALNDRATSFQVADGGTYRLDTAGPNKTGNPEVDAVLARYSYRGPGFA